MYRATTHNSYIPGTRFRLFSNKSIVDLLKWGASEFSQKFRGRFSESSDVIHPYRSTRPILNLSSTLTPLRTATICFLGHPTWNLCGTFAFSSLRVKLDRRPLRTYIHVWTAVVSWRLGFLDAAAAADESGGLDRGPTKANPRGNHHQDGLPQYGRWRRWPSQPVWVHVPHPRRASEWAFFPISDFRFQTSDFRLINWHLRLEIWYWRL